MSQPSSPRRLISIVIPAYDEESCVAELARRLQAVFESLPAYDFEVIAVDNGSVDRTFELLNQIQADDDRFKVVQLSRNFGADGGVTAGLRYAHGDAAVIMIFRAIHSPVSGFKSSSIHGVTVPSSRLMCCDLV